VVLSSGSAKRRVFQSLYEQWAVWLQMKNHNHVCNEQLLPCGEAVGEYKPLTLYIFCALCISCRPLLVAMQNTVMKRLISMLHNSDCKYNNYWHITTFLKVDFGLEFCLRWLALPVFGPHARRSTMKAYWPHCAQYVYISPPFYTRHSYYFSIWQKTFILVPNFTQDIHITSPLDRRLSY
jgi:hypothetical protein